MNSQRGTATITYAGEELVLTGDRALIWPRRQALLVADLHLGKESVFGRHGIPVPGGVTEATLARISRQLTEHNCTRLLVLGDFVHAPPAPGDRWPERVSAWLDQHPGLQCRIVAGNHDRSGTPEGLDSRLDWAPDTEFVAPFVLRHEPGRDPRGPVISGHIHPAVRLRDGRMRLYTPVFWFREHCAVLPAYGEFTGRHTVEPTAGDRVWAVTDGGLCDLSTALG